MAFENEPDAAVTADAARRAVEATTEPIRLGLLADDHPEGLVIRRLRDDEEIRWEDFHTTLPAPREARGTATLHTARSFAAYTNRLADLGTTVWADATARNGVGQVVAVFNDHTRTVVDAGKIGESLPGWRDHRALFVPQHTPEWRAWVSASGNLMGKKDFGRFLSDYAYTITGTNVSKLVDAAMALAASRVTSTNEEVDTASGQVTVTYTEEVRQQKLARAQTFPSRIPLALHVYQGAEQGDKPFDVEAVTQWDLGKDGKVQIGFRLQQIDNIRQQAWEREINRLLGLLRGEVLTLAGAAPDPLR